MQAWVVAMTREGPPDSTQNLGLWTTGLLRRHYLLRRIGPQLSTAIHEESLARQAEANTADQFADSPALPNF